MKRRIKQLVCLLGAFLITGTPLLSAAPVVAYASGDGSADAPYQITDCDELQTMYEDLTAHYELANDIDCSSTTEWYGGHGFGPIGDMEVMGPFQGSLDGKGHTISHLYQNWQGEDVVQVGGLFGAISGGSVSNLALTDIDVVGNNNTGAVAGLVLDGGSVTNVAVTGAVKGIGVAYPGIGLPISGVGGIVGLAMQNVSIEQVSFEGSVQVGMTGEEAVIMSGAGLVGLMVYGVSLRDSYANADVTSLQEGQIVVAGAVGGSLYFDDTTTPVEIENAYAAGTVTAESNNLASGFIGGLQFGSLSHSFSAASLVYEPVIDVGPVGGFMGSTAGLITLTNDFLDGRRSGSSICTNHDETYMGCTIVNTDAQPDADYFYDPTSPPLSSWDFTDVWLAHPHGFPTLRHSIIVAPADDEEETPPSHPTLPTLPKDNSLTNFFAASSKSLKPTHESKPTNDTMPVAIPEINSKPQSETTPNHGDAFFWIYVTVVGAGLVGAGAFATIRYIRRR